MSTSSPVSPKPLLSPSDLSAHQQDAIDALYEKNCLLIAPKGLGKTVCGQTAAQELIKDCVVQRVLVVAPLKVCQLSWANEWGQWSHLQQPALAVGSAAERLAAVDSDYDITVINFENVAWLVEQGLHRGFDGLLVDEVTKIKAAGGGAFKALRKVLSSFKWRSGMTADPVAEQGADIYTQMMLCDRGEALGRNKDKFMRQYFYPTDFQQRKWAILPGMDKALSAAIADTVTVIRDTTYDASLPPIRDTYIPVEMPREGWGAYNQIMDEGVIEIGDGWEVLALEAAQLSGKQQQITAGAAYCVKEGDSGRRVQWFHTAKLDAFDAWLLEQTKPVAVCYNFAFELEELRRRHSELVVLGEDPVAAEAGWTAGSVRLLAVHPKSCSHGLNLQYGGSILAVLSAPWGADPWEQLIGRFRRRGQKADHVDRVLFIVNDTIDNEILARHALKRYSSEALNDAIAES